MNRARFPVLGALALLYVAQGVPFGLAAEYLPIVLRQEGYSLKAIAAVSFLQFPWQLKALWARAADTRSARLHGRAILLAIQVVLACVMAAYALVPFRAAPLVWFVITAAAALVASTQDVFVDAFAVRSLHPSERGLGNIAQVAGYRVGILTGGAGLLVVLPVLGERATIVSCALVIALASLGAYALRTDDAPSETAAPTRAGEGLVPILKHAVHADALPVLAVAFTFKLGLHAASALMKPMVVDAGWSEQRIGFAVVTVGTVAGLLGAGVGGVVHRFVGERRALFVGMLFQAVTCVPLVVVERLGAPYVLTSAAFALEHFASGFGTTVLFAALMSATRPESAGVHYTVLTSANVIGLALGGLVGGALGDALGFSGGYVAASALCFAPLFSLRRWDTAVRASADPR
jgi:predicted MFS family arabinose efflux permease